VTSSGTLTRKGRGIPSAAAARLGRRLPVRGLGAAVLGEVADHTGIAFVYQVCAFLPAIGLLAVFLPKMPKTAH